MSMRFWIPFLAAAGLLLFWQWPYLTNPAYPNSDHSIVGLQALSILRGEWDWLTWGVSYQASLEALFAAVLFKFFGASAQALMVVAFLARVVVLAAMAFLLSRKLNILKTTLVLLLISPGTPLFFLSGLYPPRPWCLSAVALSLVFHWLATNREGFFIAFLASFLAFFALYVDYYAICFWPPLLWLGWSQRKTTQNGAGYLTGFVSGGLLLLYMRWVGPPSGPPLAFNPARIFTHAQIYWSECLPVMLGMKGRGWLDVIVGVELLALYAFGGYLVVAGRVSDPDSARWCKFGLLTFLIATLGFMGSSMASDASSVRYLAPLIWVAPLVLIPAALWWNDRTLAVLIVPILIAWNMAHISLSRPDRARSVESQRADKQLLETLLSHEVAVAEAPYFEAYRLTMEFGEKVIVVPEFGDRYAPYRARFNAQPKFARVLSPAFGPDRLKQEEEKCIAESTRCSHFRVGDYFVALWTKN